MKISTDDVIYIAKLAKLHLGDEEIERLTGEFESILTYFQSIDRIDLENVDLNKAPDAKQQSVVRADENIFFMDSDKLFRNTKSRRETYIQVPKIIK